MAEAVAKIKDGSLVNCNTGDTDGLLVNTLLEALTGTNRLNVGAYGRSTRTPTNYSAATQSIDDHLAGIDTVLGAGPAAHLMGSASHTADSLGNLNAKVTGGSLDFSTAQRTATIHNIGSNLRHAADTLANLNTLVTGGNLDFDSASRPPSAHDLDSHGSCTLAELNADVSDATLDTNSASRPPNGSASSDLSGTYPGPTVARLQGYSIQSGAPAANDILQYISSSWQHVQGVKANYDSGWFAVAYNQTYSKAHGLGGHPSHVEVYWAVTNSSPSTIYRVPAFTSSGESAGRGCQLELNSTYVIVRSGTGSGAGTFDTYGFGGTRVYSAAGYYKVLAWGPTHV